MPDLIALIESVSDKSLLVIIVMALAAMVEAALGLGVFIPGETVVVIGATVLAHASGWWVALGVLMVAVGATAGDHFGWFVGRKVGEPIGRSRAVESIGFDKWDRAMQAVQHQRLVPLIVVRQLPGVRTLVAAACGAAGVSYARFATASVLGALIWALLWVGGGALVGHTVIDILGPLLPIALLAWILVILGLFLRKRLKARNAGSQA